jgi:ADP-Ribosyltransferase in polyvalent proteins/Large polyvalent protein associated domain 39
MARTNSTVSACFKAASGIKPAEAKAIGDLAESYGTGDIAADYAAAVQDIIEQHQNLLKAVKSEFAKASQSPKAKALWDTLNKWLPLNPEKVTIVDSVADLPANLQASVNKERGVTAFVTDGHAYLIADRIDPKKARGDLLHEVGAHIGLENMLTMRQYENLVAKMKEWAAGPEGLEKKIAQAALARVEAAGEKDELQRHTEMVAYFVEEAVDAGVEPSAAAPKGSLARWLHDIFEVFQKAFQKLLNSPGELTAQDIVDMAYGAAHIEMQEGEQRDTGAAAFSKTDAFRRWFGDSKVVGPDGKPLVVYHGTNADFNEFDDSTSGAATGRSRGTGLGFWFTEDADAAAIFAQLKDQGGNLMPVYLSIKNPYRLTGAEFMKLMVNTSQLTADEQWKAMRDFRDGLIAKGYDGIQIPKQVYQQIVKLPEGNKSGLSLKHIIMKPAQAGTEGAGTRWVAFEPTQIKSAIGNSGNYDPNNADIRFSKAVSPETQAHAEENERVLDEYMAKISKATPQPARDFLTNTTAKIKAFAPRLLTDHQLAQTYDKLKALQLYDRLRRLMETERGEIQQRSHQISVQWQGLKNDVRNRLDLLMKDATRQKIDPAEKFGQGVNAHLQPTDRAKYDSLVARYNALGKDGQAVYTAARDELRQQWEERFAAYNKSILDMYNDLMAEAMENNDPVRFDELKAEADKHIEEHGKLLARLRQGPYFPLLRFGEHLAVGKSSEFVALQKQIKEAKGEERRALEKRLDEMKADPKHYQMSAHETPAESKRAQMKYRELFGNGEENAYQTLADQHLTELSRTSQHFLATMIEHATAGMDTQNAADTKQALTNMYIRALPEMHALRREAERKGVEGASTDMLRAFASASNSNAFFTSRLLHSKDLTSALYQMKEEAKNNPDLQQIHREMEKRMALSMTRQETPVQDAISSVTWLYKIGVSPASLMVNMTQPWLVSVPIIAGKFGMGTSLSAMSKATASAAKIIADARTKDGKWDWWSGISENSLSSKEERTMIRELLKRGVLNDGAQNDNAAIASGEKMYKFHRVTGWAMQQAEMMNRLSTALAAFRLARGKMNYEDALKYAYDTTLDTQMDYSSDGAARIMRTGGGVPLAKLVFQFRRFQQGMLYLLVHNARKAYGGDKEARAALAYLTATSGLAAGALGLPLMNTAFAIANMFLDKDDPDGDAETQFRNWLTDLLGDKDTATVVAKGLPAAFGLDVSNRIGLGDVASPFPFAKFEHKNGKEDTKELLFNAAGASASTLASVWNGVLQFEAGNFQKGVEGMAPKGIADLVKGARYATEGMTDTQGHKTGTELDALDVMYRTLGFSPVAESNYFEGQRAIKDTEAAVKDHMGQIGEQFKLSLQNGDMSDVREQIAEFNAKHPTHPITPKVEQQWRTEVRNDRKARQAGTGIKLGKGRDASYNEVGRFATGR